MAWFLTHFLARPFFLSASAKADFTLLNLVVGDFAVGDFALECAGSRIPMPCHHRAASAEPTDQTWLSLFVTCA
jgi:hypothetical protein